MNYHLKPPFGGFKFHEMLSIYFLSMKTKVSGIVITGNMTNHSPFLLKALAK